VAFWSVVAIVVSGCFATWRQVGTLDALTSTDYGRLLMLKVGVVASLVGVAWLSRRVLDQWRRGEPAVDDDGPPAAPARDLGGAGEPEPATEVLAPEWDVRTRIRVSLTIEIVLAILVLAITAALVETPPARDAVSGPVSRTITAEPLTFDLTVEPATAGDNLVHVYVFDEDGAIFDPQAVSLEIRLVDPEIGPLDVPLVRIATGHWQADSADLPLPGDWVFTIAADIDQFTRASGSTQIPIS
jgi:copper transport protein